MPFFSRAWWLSHHEATPNSKQISKIWNPTTTISQSPARQHLRRLEILVESQNHAFGAETWLGCVEAVLMGCCKNTKIVVIENQHRTVKKPQISTDQVAVGESRQSVASTAQRRLATRDDAGAGVCPNTWLRKTFCHYPATGNQIMTGIMISLSRTSSSSSSLLLLLLPLQSSIILITIMTILTSSPIFVSPRTLKQPWTKFAYGLWSYGSEESHVINGSNMLKHVETCWNSGNHHGTPWRFLVGNEKSRLATSAAPDLISRSERQTSSACDVGASVCVYKSRHI